MAISKLSPTINPGGGFGDWAYVHNQPEGAEMYEFVADGNEQTNTIAGARYRVLKYYDTGNFVLPWDRNGKIDLLVVGGGGTGGGFTQDNTGAQYIGGGGAGGYVAEYNRYVTGPSSLTVGLPGQNVPNSWQNGKNSSFDDIIAVGGGHQGANLNGVGAAGGSGGGGTGSGKSGAGNLGQGHDGGSSSNGGGGGGAGGAGNGTLGGPGLYRNWDGVWRWYAGGGMSGNRQDHYNGQTPYKTHASIETPGNGGGGNYYDGGTGNETQYNGQKGIIIVRFRVG